jgi:hypothetical protein
MEDAPDLKFLATPLEQLVRLFSELGKPGVILGGVAAGVWGKARATGDVDGVILADDEDFPKLLELAAQFGLTSRKEHPIEFAKKSKIFLFTHVPSGVNVDLAIGMTPFEREAIERAKIVAWRGLSIPIMSPEDLIIAKAVARRTIDLADIEWILKIQQNLDIKRIRYWVKQFAEVLEAPEIYDTIDDLLKKFVTNPKGVKGKTRSSAKKK